MVHFTHAAQVVAGLHSRLGEWLTMFWMLRNDGLVGVPRKPLMISKWFCLDGLLVICQKNNDHSWTQPINGVQMVWSIAIVPSTAMMLYPQTMNVIPFHI